MKKAGLKILLAGALLFAAGIFPQQELTVRGEEAGYEEYGTESSDQTDETETEEVLPESYYLPIESNEVSGWPQGPQIEAEAAVVMDEDTGAFLYSKNMEAKEYPASITKIMTCLLALEHGNLNDTVTFSESVYGIEYGSSHVGIQPGEQMSLRDALYALMLASANDAAVGIAEHIAGSVDAFVEMMNEKAAQLGCTNTHFTNPHGLHDENHYTCARDMALIARAAYQNRNYRRIVGTQYYNIEETNEVDEIRYLANHQQMLMDGEFHYDGCTGGKTGFTEDSLNTLVTYAGREKRTLICVLLRVNGIYKMYDETARLLDYGFDNFKRLRVRIPEYSSTWAELAGADTLGEMSVTYAPCLTQKAVNKQSSIVLDVPRNLESGDITRRLTENGTIRFSYEGWDLGSADVSFASMNLDISGPRLSAGTAAALTARQETEEEQSLQEQALHTVSGFWGVVREQAGRLNSWILDNDLTAAVIGLVLIVLMIPMLLIAWTRNSKAKKIRRARKQERDERVRIEKDIESRPVSEIEQELRKELEKEREQRRLAEEKRARQEKEEAEMQEAEKIIEKEEALREAEQAVLEIRQETSAKDEGGEEV